MHIFSGQGPKLAMEIAYRDEEIDPGCADYPGKLAMSKLLVPYILPCCWPIIHEGIQEQIVSSGTGRINLSMAVKYADDHQHSEKNNLLHWIILLVF